MPFLPRPLGGALFCAMALALVSCESSDVNGDGPGSGYQSRFAGQIQRGQASWYGPGFFGNRMASGKVYLSSDVAAAHPSLPFNTWLCVKNLNNGRFVKVEVLDRGPFTGGRILDLTSRAADALEMKGSGVVPIEMRVLGFQSDSCGEPDVAQQCRSTLEAWHDVRDGGDVLHVTVDARCTAAKVSVYLGSRDMTRSRGTAEEPLQVDELGKQKQAVVDLSALREEDPQKIFEAARVELVDASGRVLYRTGFEGRPSPLLKPLQRSEVCRDTSGTVDAARSALGVDQDSDDCPADESTEAASAP